MNYQQAFSLAVETSPANPRWRVRRQRRRSAVLRAPQRCGNEQADWAGRLRLTSIRSCSARPRPGPVDVVDLFCGCGGLSLGFEAAGRLTRSFQLAGAVDIATHAIATYGLNLPVQPLSSDLGAASATSGDLEDLVRALGVRKNSSLVLVGGPPCQGFSAHRKRDSGPPDPRNDLILAYAPLQKGSTPTSSCSRTFRSC